MTEDCKTKKLKLTELEAITQHMYQELMVTQDVLSGLIYCLKDNKIVNSSDLEANIVKAIDERKRLIKENKKE